MSVAPIRPSPVATLFPPDRVKRHLLTTGYGRCGARTHLAVTVVGADGVERLVERSRPLTGVELAAIERGAR